MEEKQQIIKPIKIRLAAMDLLTGREYLRSELAQKLAQKFDNSPLIGEVLEQLISDGLQSDKRFVQAFVRSRIMRGQGEVRIRMELYRRGADKALADRAVANFDVDWFELARTVALNKFGANSPADNREKAKRIRFLQYRGFSYDQINHALSQHIAEE
ncbi:MAG: recombination regulator RecX [Porticoccaceae bacterium]|nr:recombination regulator RecX [Porticoccaceae bacterium]